MQMGTRIVSGAVRHTRAVMLGIVAAGALAFAATPCLAQNSAKADESAYLARMNEGYAAAKAGDQLRAAAAFDLAAKAAPTRAEPLNAAAYAYLAAKRNDSAIDRFNASLKLEPDRDIIRRQVGYLYSATGQQRNAIEAFSVLRREQRASPQDLLALGNLNNMVGEHSLALSSFRAARKLAEEFGDTAVARSAASSIAVLSAASLATPGLWTEVYLAPFYQRRFENFLSLGFVRAGVSAGGALRPSLYVSLRAGRDSKSTGGLQPVQYADNSVLPAVGVRVQPGGLFTLYAEAGAAYPLLDIAPKAWQRDLRAGINAGASRTFPLLRGAHPVSIVSDAYADASWYERFDKDVIAYGQLREALRLLEGAAGAFDVYGRLWGAFDSRNQFSNRVGEAAGGAALHLGRNHAVSLYVEGVHGRYLNTPNAAQGGRNYDDVRVMVVTGWTHVVPFARP